MNVLPHPVFFIALVGQGGELKSHILQNLTFVKYEHVSIGYGREKDASGVVKCGSLDLHIFLPVLKKSPSAFCPGGEDWTGKPLHKVFTGNQPKHPSCQTRLIKATYIVLSCDSKCDG